MEERKKSLDGITSEYRILLDHIKSGKKFDSHIPVVQGKKKIKNIVGAETLGSFRSTDSRKSVSIDLEILNAFMEKFESLPTFLAAGPRTHLLHNPREIRAAIVTTGGLAPGMHSVIHSIVTRHCDIYSFDATRGKIFGVFDSFKGLSDDLADNLFPLDPGKTEEWIDHGGSRLGMIRYFGDKNLGKDAAMKKMLEDIDTNLTNNQIDILYVIGGDGSLKFAHELALKNLSRSIVGIPKTMDNDILWVDQSFGFDTAVEQAALVINTLHIEASSTRRICLIELFGAESGFVAANAALASGHVDLVLIPEVFLAMDKDQILTYLDGVIKQLGNRIQRKMHHNSHAVVVVAEGVGTVLRQKGVSVETNLSPNENFIYQLGDMIEKKIRDVHGHPMSVFVNQPRHHIRAVTPNSHDHIYCYMLGALAVDNALAGYTDFMVSEWLTKYVLVPLSFVGEGKKGINIQGRFWKQVVNCTGQSDI